MAGATSDAIKSIPGVGSMSSVGNDIKRLGQWGVDKIGDAIEAAEDKVEGETLEPIDPEDNPRIDPSAALDESSNSSGYNTAKDFWEYRAGLHTDGTTTVISLIIMLIGVAMIILYIIPIMLLTIVNMVFAIYLMIAGGGLAINLILMAFRSSKPKGAR